MNETIHRNGSLVTLSLPLITIEKSNDFDQHTPPRTRTLSPPRSTDFILPSILQNWTTSMSSLWGTRRFLSFPPVFQVIASISTLCLVPIALYGNVPVSSLPNFLEFLKICWDSLLHFNTLQVSAFTLALSFYFSYRQSISNSHTQFLSTFDNTNEGISPPPRRKISDYDPLTDPTLMAVGKHIDCEESFKTELFPIQESKPCFAMACENLCSNFCTPRIAPMFLIVVFSVAIASTSQLHIIHPSIIWMPFAWGTYKLYPTRDLSRALQGLCLIQEQQALDQQSLCLSEDSWKRLSAGKLSSKNPDDVATVMKGIEYSQTSAGLVVNVMARDTIEAIEPLRQNMDALSKFFPKLSLVVFENDSSDGTRDAFIDWGKNAIGYSVDVMECEEAPSCKLGDIHRYEKGFENEDYFQESAVGSMVQFRQRMADYILSSPAYRDYTHVLVMDMDLGISLSPLGVLHSLGKTPDNAIASSGRTLWPGSLGSIAVPYDFSAFRPYITDKNRRIAKIHRKMFCGLMSPGDKWRNQCDAISSMHMIEVLMGDRLDDTLYQVDSAFNGAVLYPLKDLRESGTKYDWGDDGQRCEHIGYNLGLKNAMYVNQKWNMHLNPSHPGGPSGPRAMKQVYRISVVPQLGLVIFFQNVGSMIAFVYSIMTLGMHVVFPLLVKNVINFCLSRRRVARDFLPLKRFGS
jgi:hypothetical protein